MAQPWIKNFDALATSEDRKAALSLLEAALNAIDTAQVIAAAVTMENGVLRVKHQEFDLARMGRIFLVGFGKAAGDAAEALEKILGARLAGGVVIGVARSGCRRVEVLQGTHPLPSETNVAASQKIVDLAAQLQADDLVIVIVSGGGSALLCWPQEECEQGRRLYHDFVRAGGTIKELNTVRKHLSGLKGGGLAKMLHPASVIGLIFSDVPGDKFDAVASGPTYRDDSTVADAERVLAKYGLGGYALHETPQEKHLFDKVVNVPLVSNVHALEAMVRRGAELGLTGRILSHDLYDPASQVAQNLLTAAKTTPPVDFIVAGGEPEVKVPAQHGRGGRNQLLTLCALPFLEKNQLFLSFGSDGQDNGDVAGAMADAATQAKARKLGLDTNRFLAQFDARTFFEQTGDLIDTGPTGANVSDLMLLLTNHK